MVGIYVLVFDGGGLVFCIFLFFIVGIYIYVVVFEFNFWFCLILIFFLEIVDVCVMKVVGINKYERYFYVEWYLFGFVWWFYGIIFGMVMGKI